MRVYRDKSGFWHADFRRWGWGRPSLGLTASVDQPRAEHAASELFLTLSRERGQQALPIEAPRVLADMLSRWLAGERWSRQATRDFCEKHARATANVMGDLPIAPLFERERSVAAWDALIRLMHKYGWAAKTNHHRFSVCKRAALWLCGRGWGYDERDLPRRWPKVLREGERRAYVPRSRWLTEDEFYAFVDSPHFLPQRRAGAFLRERSRREFWRKRAFFFLCFYCGLHYSDAESITWGHFELDASTWWNINTKNQKTHRPDRTDLPVWVAGLLRDERDLRARLSAPPPRTEPIVGPWRRANQRIRDYCARAGVEHFCCLDLRRSCATAMRDAGHSESTVARYLGHSSSQMVRDVYAQVPEASLRRAIRETWVGPPAPPEIPGEAPVIPLFRHENESA